MDISSHIICDFFQNFLRSTSCNSNTSEYKPTHRHRHESEYMFDSRSHFSQDFVSLLLFISKWSNPVSLFTNPDFAFRFESFEYALFLIMRYLHTRISLHRFCPLVHQVLEIRDRGVRFYTFFYQYCLLVILT
jgi:hypothetical protein